MQHLVVTAATFVSRSNFIRWVKLFTFSNLGNLFHQKGQRGKRKKSHLFYLLFSLLPWQGLRLKERAKEGKGRLHFNRLLRPVSSASSSSLSSTLDAIKGFIEWKPFRILNFPIDSLTFEIKTSLSRPIVVSQQKESEESHDVEFSV